MFCCYKRSFNWSCFSLVCCQGQQQRSLRSSGGKVKKPWGNSFVTVTTDQEKPLSHVHFLQPKAQKTLKAGSRLLKRKATPSSNTFFIVLCLQVSWNDRGDETHLKTLRYFFVFPSAFGVLGSTKQHNYEAAVAQSKGCLPIVSSRKDTTSAGVLPKWGALPKHSEKFVCED